MNEQEPKRSRGRPKKAAGEHGKQLTIYLPPEVREWLKAQPEGPSKAICHMVRKAMRKKV